jgi:hypothetical protein
MGDYSGIAAVSPTLVAALWTDMRVQKSNNGLWAEDAFFALVDPPAGGNTASNVPLSEFAPSLPADDISSRDAFFALANALTPGLGGDRAAFAVPAPASHSLALTAVIAQPIAATEQTGGQALGSSIKQAALAGGTGAADLGDTADADADEFAVALFWN